jgi:hypothetical protein
VLLYRRTLPARDRSFGDARIMLAALIGLQVVIDIAHAMMKNLPKC